MDSADTKKAALEKHLTDVISYLRLMQGVTVPGHLVPEAASLVRYLKDVQSQLNKQYLITSNVDKKD